jgi:hypothetical protein
MITFNRVANVAPGKMASAVEFANRSAAYLKHNYGIDFAVSVPIGGNPLRIAWTARTENLSAFDELVQKLLADKQYASMVNEYSDSLLPGSVSDAFWRTI